MKIRLARYAGFCMGVKRALELVLKEAGTSKMPTFTYGPIIHNNQVLEVLKKRGIKVLKERGVKGGSVVIRAHGVPPKTKEDLLNKGYKVVDGTCPRVLGVQALARRYSAKGRDVVIVGEKDHPEVIGIVGHTNNKAMVINSEEEVEGLIGLNNPVVIAQTTQDRDRFWKIVQRLRNSYPELEAHETICNATKLRQDEIKRLSFQSDLVLVIGDRNSGNTRRLFEISKKINPNTFMVETEKEIKAEWFRGVKVVAVSAGASTPNWMIMRVLRRLEEISGKSESLASRTLRGVVRALFCTGLLPSMGLFGMVITSVVLMDLARHLRYPTAIGLLYYAMVVMARFMDKDSHSYNDPYISSFLERYKGVVIATGWISGILGTFLTGVVFPLSHLGIALLLLVVVASYKFRKGFSKIFDFPGIRSIGEAVIWTILSGPFLLFLYEKNETLPIVSITLFCLNLGLLRSLILDVLHLQGDLIIGQKSLSVKLGDKRVNRYILYLLISCLLILVIAGALGLFSTVSFALTFALVGIFLCYISYTKRWVMIPSRVEILLESMFLFMGYISYIWDRLISNNSWSW